MSEFLFLLVKNKDIIIVIDSVWKVGDPRGMLIMMMITNGVIIFDGSDWF